MDATHAPASSPYDASNWRARASYVFVRPLLKLAETRDLTPGDLPPVPRRDEVPAIASRLDTAWEDEVARRGDDASFLRAMLECFRSELLSLGAWMWLEYAPLRGDILRTGSRRRRGFAADSP